MKGLPICFSEVQVKNDVTDNNNKHFVTAFEGECRNIIELREHLKLCFLIILVVSIRFCYIYQSFDRTLNTPTSQFRKVHCQKCWNPRVA